MKEEKRLSPYSVRSHGSQTARFLQWFGQRHRLLARARVEEVDEFLAMKGVSGWNRKSVSMAAAQLLSFMDDKIRNGTTPMNGKQNGVPSFLVAHG
jgi:integrase family protein with SAM-like domain